VLRSLERARIGEPERVANAMYRSLGTGVFELIGLLLTPWRRVHVEGLERAVSALGSRGTGAVIATAHTGNWDWVACGTARAWPLTVITKRLSVGWLDRLWQGLRRGRGVRLAEAGRAAGPALRRLARGELVATMIDQAPERRRAIAHVPFLGETAEVDLVPALLAMRARCPLLVAFPKRTAAGHGIVVMGWLIPPERPNRQWAVSAMRQATAWLEEFVREQPEQWLWMHRRWKLGSSSAQAAAPPGHESNVRPEGP
jgi:KDO2-lipid IV(A) lauroyltransferase